MMVELPLTKQISDFRILIDDILSNVDNDTLSYDTLQIFQQENYHLLFEKLKNFDLEKLLIDAKNSNLNRNVFHGILTSIGNYSKLYKKLSSKFFAFDYGRLYELYLFEKYGKKIAILENDIKEVEDPENQLPQKEKTKLITEFKKELLCVIQQKNNLRKDFGWFFNNYYEGFNIMNQNAEKLIQSYFPEHSLEAESDYFPRNFINDLYNICEQNMIFDSDNITFENFYLILNQRKPKISCTNFIKKKTVFAFPIKHLSLKINDKLKRELWIDQICSKFGLNAKSINSHGNNKNIATEAFYNLFDVKIQV
jgi:hypothetical protein